MDRIYDYQNRQQGVGIKTDGLYPHWWCGGLAGAITQFAVAPFDLLESRMMAIKKDIPMNKYIRKAIKKDGFFSLYDGLSAQLLRQLTYTSMRFHIYETGKNYVDQYNFLHKMFVASIAGIMAGVVGIPTEMVNTRMHIDRALKAKCKRHYRNVFDGLYKVCRDEGCASLYNGWVYSCMRAAMITIGQNAFYDQAKYLYMKHTTFKDEDKILHIISSLTAAIACVPLVQPLEVLKTVNQSVRSGKFKTLEDEVRFMMRFGARGLFRGIVPSMLRLVPNTILIFVIYEQLRLHFGYYGSK